MSFVHLPRLPGWLLAGCCLWLAGCATAPSPVPVPVLQPDQTARLTALSDWQLQGRLNIRDEQSSETINLHWAQQGAGFEIRLSGTLGLGAVRLSGNAQGALLEKNGQRPVQLPDLDALSRDALDYDFPASHLRWWIRGLPAPGLEVLSRRSADSLMELRQRADNGQQWHLQFDRYQQVDGLPLPGRIRLESQGLRLTLLISEWTLGNAFH